MLTFLPNLLTVYDYYISISGINIIGTLANSALPASVTTFHTSPHLFPHYPIFTTAFPLVFSANY